MSRERADLVLWAIDLGAQEGVAFVSQAEMLFDQLRKELLFLFRRWPPAMGG